MEHRVEHPGVCCDGRQHPMTVVQRHWEVRRGVTLLGSGAGLVLRRPGEPWRRGRRGSSRGRGGRRGGF